MLGGQWVPGGTNICSNTGALLRSRSLFGPDADVFRPERFTELEATPHRRDMERSVEFAFGSGQWQCVGRKIALMKMSKTVFEVSSHSLSVWLCPHRPSERVLHLGTWGRCRLACGVALGLIVSCLSSCSGTSTCS